MKSDNAPILVDNLLPSNKSGVDDLFICCASFEERSISGVLKLSDTFRTKFSIIFIIEEPLYEQEIAKHLNIIRNELMKRTINRVLTISSQRQYPLDGISQFKYLWDNYCLQLSGGLFMTVDISGFTKIFLLEMFNFITRGLNLGMPRIIHTAQNYSPNKLTKGVEEIVNMPSFIGNPSSQKQTLLVVFLGFEIERTLSIWEHYYPMKTIALVTDPPRDGKENYLKYVKDNNGYLLSRPSVEVRKVPSDSPYVVKEVLKSIYYEFGSSYNIIVSPLGTKPQAVGLFLFWLQYQDTQIVYSFPVEYTKSYLNRKPGKTLLILDPY